MTEQPGGRDGPDRSGREGHVGKSAQSSDIISDLQRWLIRSGAKSMRKEIGDQFRRTLGGAADKGGDVWDTATHEIPPEAGEAPECQWCPICRAARAMRESRPGLGAHLSGAGDAVATAVQDAISLLDSVLARTGDNRNQPEAKRSASGDGHVPSYSPDDQADTSASGPVPERGAAADARAGAMPPEEQDTWSQATDEDSAATARDQPNRLWHGPNDRS